MKNNNQKGYALVWTMIVLLMLTLLATAVLQMAGAMSQRSLTKNQNNQAYFTALSVVDAIVAQLSGPLDETQDAAAVELLKKLRANGKASLSSISGLPAQMGDCTASLVLANKTLTITATATVAGQSYTLSAVLGGTVIKPAVPPVVGAPGLGLGGMGGSGLTGGPTSGLLGGKDTSLYIWDENDMLNIQHQGDARSTLHMGSIYSKGAVSLFDSHREPDGHVHGELVCDKDITIAGTMTIGPYSNKCCENQAPSFVYTLGTLTLKEKALLGCNVSAPTVRIGNEARVWGRITADDLAIAINGTNKPDIDASKTADDTAIVGNTVELTNQTQVVGNVIANTLVLDSNATILGNVTANELTLSNGATITGNVTANTVRLYDQAGVVGKVTADTLRMGGTARVDGEATANIVNSVGGSNFITSLRYYDMSGYNGAEGSAVPLAAPIPMPASGEDPVPASFWVSKVPEPIEPTELTAPTDTPVLGSNGAVTLDARSQRVVVRVQEHRTITNLAVQGSNPAVIFVADGCTLALHKISVPDSKKPNLFVVLGQNAVLELGDKALEMWQIDQNGGKIFPLYVLSKLRGGAQVLLEYKATVYGGISADGIRPLRTDYRKTDWSFHWVAPGDLSWMGDLINPPAEPEEPSSGGGSSGGSGGGSGSGGSGGEEEVPDVDDVIEWELERYHKG